MRILKENSIDCQLNYNRNTFKNEQFPKNKRNIEIETSKGVLVNYEQGDKDGCRVCDYMDCDFKCKSGIKNITEDIELDTDTYDLEYSKDLVNLIEINIIKLFMIDNCYSLTYIIKTIKEILK